jgi:hypothetical protein
MLAPIFSVFSSKSISFATVTQSFVTIGHPKGLSRITFLPFGHIVTFTASATISIQEKISFLASSPYLISFAIFVICVIYIKCYLSKISRSFNSASSDDLNSHQVVYYTVVLVLVIVSQGC